MNLSTKTFSYENRQVFGWAAEVRFPKSILASLLNLPKQVGKIVTRDQIEI